MEVNNNVKTNTAYSQATNTKATENKNNTTSTNSTSKTNETNKNDNKGVVYEKSSTSKTKYTPNKNKINQMLSQQERDAQTFTTLVSKMFDKQNLTFKQSINLISSGNFTADADTIKKAQEDISEDGYWGVKKTSERILDFAKALSGGDPSKIEMLRKSVQKGFGAAADEWGKKKMPQITQDTYDAVMQGFDEWAASYNTVE